VTSPDGALVVDKPAGPTSHDVVAVARRALGTQRVGHTGTLDPLATGVLVLVVGKATRLARYMTHDVKAYEARVTFGRATATYDAQGETTTETNQRPDTDALVAALAGHLGRQQQVPPAFSAKKVGGQVAHRAARLHAPLALAPVSVDVQALTLVGYHDGVATLSLRVSAGFYVRSLAHDLGVELGVGAHLSGLRRTEVGAFGLDRAVRFEALAAGGEGVRAAVVSCDDLLPGMPAARLAPAEVERVCHGQALPWPGTGTLPSRGEIRLLDADGHLVGIAVPSAESGPGGRGFLQPVVIVR
jgi:tRNA pseudouridine55 synthase